MDITFLFHILILQMWDVDIYLGGAERCDIKWWVSCSPRLLLAGDPDIRTLLHEQYLVELQTKVGAFSLIVQLRQLFVNSTNFYTSIIHFIFIFFIFNLSFYQFIDNVFSATVNNTLDIAQPCWCLLCSFCLLGRILQENKQRLFSVQKPRTVLVSPGHSFLMSLQIRGTSVMWSVARESSSSCSTDSCDNKSAKNCVWRKCLDIRISAAAEVKTLFVSRSPENVRAVSSTDHNYWFQKLINFMIILNVRWLFRPLITLLTEQSTGWVGSI